jgi:radical SAM superfamily enzyme YgiQ (UPF0313 family)
MDILLTHGYFLYDDPHELAVMKPYPPLGLLYINAHLKAHGIDSRIFDTTFSRQADLEAYLERERPPIVGVYSNLMTRSNALRVIAAARRAGSRVVVGGPDPANYLDEYLSRDVDVIAIGEGELTLEELVPHLLQHGPSQLGGIQGIAFRDDDGQIVRTEPRPMIADLDAQPFPDRAAIDQPKYVSGVNTTAWAPCRSLPRAVVRLRARGAVTPCSAIHTAAARRQMSSMRCNISSIPMRRICCGTPTTCSPSTTSGCSSTPICCSAAVSICHSRRSRAKTG